jgi:hypothetical protein
MKKITDKDFRYTPAASTDIRKTFDRIRREQKKQAEALQHVLIQISRKKTA